MIIKTSNDCTTLKLFPFYQILQVLQFFTTVKSKRRFKFHSCMNSSTEKYNFLYFPITELNFFLKPQFSRTKNIISNHNHF